MTVTTKPEKHAAAVAAWDEAWKRADAVRARRKIATRQAWGELRDYPGCRAEGLVSVTKGLDEGEKVG